MFTFKKYASPLGQFVWKHKGKISLVLGIVTTGYVQRVYRLSVAPKLIESIPMEREVALIPRDAGRHIRIAAANGIHMLVLGPHGVGKTVSVKQAVDGLTDIETINNPTTFLPFYVNLYKAVRPAVQLATAENKGVIETTQHAIDADAAKRVAAAFHAALAMFDTTMLEVTQSGWIYQLERQIGRDWASLLSFFFGSPNAPPPQSESIRPYLQQVMDSAKFSKEVYLFSKHRGFIPVVVIDEVHMLADPALPKIRDEFVAFLMEALADKRSSPVVIILLSSDGNAEKIINSCEVLLLSSCCTIWLIVCRVQAGHHVKVSAARNCG
jgi:Cdc6-like AAA superfamily ATPase